MLRLCPGVRPFCEDNEWSGIQKTKSAVCYTMFKSTKAGLNFCIGLFILLVKSMNLNYFFLVCILSVWVH